MRFIPTRVHGLLDYLVAVLLILSPTLFDFRLGGPAQWLPIGLGIAVIFYSLITDYELGAVRVLPFRTHLALDSISGVILALSPWVLGFADAVWAPHLLLGLLEIVAVMASQTPAPTSVRR
jgi:hypothetical protein